jgi:hypothetical protein
LIVKPVREHVAEEPSFIREFKESSSVYEIPKKVEDDEISSDGEFINANKMKKFPEDATEVFLIERKN